MRILPRNRSRKTAISLVSLFPFLFFTVTAPMALAQSDWPTWPPKKPVPAPAPAEPMKETIAEEPVREGAPAAVVPPAPAAAAPAPATPAADGAGAAAGKSTTAGVSSGTLGWAAAIIGAGVLIGVAAGGGGSSTSGHP